MLAFAPMAPVVDLRSDTVTRPTPEMRRAMAEAEVGDDVYGEDPTVNRLQQAAAALLGYEAALFVPSGVMANEIAIRLLTTPGQEVLADERSHVVQFELAGMAVLSGVMPRLARSEDGILTADQVRAALRPPSYLRSDLALAVFENTHNFAGGVVATVAATRAFLAACAEAGLKTHLDGARLWNAAVALGVAPRELAAGFDTVMVTLSKGLCAPAGSLLLGSAARMEQARRVRKLLGGGMRQVGILAAAGLVAIETMVDRLAEDHAHAQLLGEALAACTGVEVRPVPTNIVLGVLERGSAPDAAAALQRHGVLASVMDTRTLRLVTHRDVSRADCERAAGALRAVLG
ncbi:MAG TPA: GntG family PLP-dependent aldolase [Vicinamibacteria bacterium]